MKGIDNKIKVLKLMGYSVINNPQFDEIRVMFKTKSGYTAHRVVRYEELLKDFIVEDIVHSINRLINNDL